MKTFAFLTLLLFALVQDASAYLSPIGGGGGGGGITSINGDSTAAQIITGGTSINVVTSSGTTTISYTGVPTIQPAVLTTTNATPSTVYSFPVASGSSYFLTANCAVRRTDAPDHAMYEKKVGVFNEGSGAVMQGTVNATFAESSDTSWVLTWVTSGGNVVLQATGAAGKTIDWTCSISYVQGS